MNDMVRKAQLSDAERISEIIIYGWRNAYIDFLGEEALYKDMSVVKRYKTLCSTLESDHGFYVYEENGIVKGFMRLEQCTEHDEVNAMELVAIYVEPYFKGRGIGSKLIQEAEKIATGQVKRLEKFDQNEVRYVKKIL